MKHRDDDLQRLLELFEPLGECVTKVDGCTRSVAVANAPSAV
ncbi:MAG: hypothetical protein QOH91_2541 [Mycobacterium sp.]|jgi:hypothetical protein|nr:hypothetical protein [Mycobacterium sp.]